MRVSIHKHILLHERDVNVPYKCVSCKMGTLNLSSIKRSIKHFSEWGLAWRNAKKENHYYSFFPPSPFHFLQTVSQFSRSYKQSSATSVQNRECWLFMPQAGISGVCPHSIYLSPFHGDFPTPFDCLRTKGWQWKKALWAFTAFGCRGRGVCSDTAVSLQPQWPPPTGKAQLLQHWEPRKRQECTSVPHKWQEDSWEPSVVGGKLLLLCSQDSWKWSLKMENLLLFSSTSAQHRSRNHTNHQSTENAVLPLWAVWDYHRWGLTNAATGKFLQPGSQWTVCIASSGNQLFRVIIDYTNIHNNLWFLFPLGAPIFALREWSHMIPMWSCLCYIYREEN